jgi:hypothetical protein
MTVIRRSIVHGFVVAVVHALAFATVAAAESWTRAYVNALPDEAFAVVHVRPDGTRSRHLPHHDAEGQLDFPHLRSARARLDQVHWEDPADAERARQHLLAHEEAFGIGRRSARPYECSRLCRQGHPPPPGNRASAAHPFASNHGLEAMQAGMRRRR